MAANVLLIQRDADTANAAPSGVALASQNVLEEVTHPEEALERLARAEHGVEALVLPPDLEEPLEFAQRAHALDADVAIVILCEPQRCIQVARALEFAPFVGEDVVVLSTAEERELPAEVADAALRTRRRRSFRGLAEPVGAQRVQAPPAEQYLGQLLEHAPIGVAVVDASGALIGWNARAGEMLGASEPDMVGNPLCDLFRADRRDEITEFIERAARDESASATATFERTAASGNAQFVELTAAALTGRAGRRGVMLLLRDVTDRVVSEDERRSMEEALRFQKTLLESQSEASVEGTLVVSRDGQILSFNRRFGEVLGILDEGPGMRSGDAARAALETRITEPGDFLDRFTALTQDAAATSRDDVVLDDGRTFETYSAPLTNAERLHYGRVWFFRETTEPRRAEARLRFLAEATELVTRSLDYQATLASIARLAIPALADWCIVDELRPDGELARVAVAAADSRKQEILEELRERYPPTWDSPQPAARALRSGEIAVFEEFSAESLRETVRDDAHYSLLTELAPSAAIAVPLLAHGQKLGAITFAFAESNRKYGPSDVALAGELARRAALGIDRARLYAAEQTARLTAEAAQERLAFLADASAMLAASLEYEATLEAIAELAVPRLADWCILYAVDPDGEIRRLVVEHTNEAQREAVTAHLVEVPLDPNAREGIPRVIRSGEPVLYEDATAALLASDVTEPERVQPVLEELGIKSWMCVALVAGGRAIGAISFVSTRSERRYTRDDLALAEELARRAGLAVDNARLYEEAQEAFRLEREARARAERAHEIIRHVELVSEAALSHLELGELLHEILSRVATVVSADTAAILLLDEETNELVAHSARGLEREVEQGVRIPVGRGFSGRIAAELRPIAIEDVATTEIVNPIIHEEGITSLLGVPLVAERRLTGVLHVGTYERRVFTDEDTRLLQLAADRVALALAQSRLYEAERAARAEAQARANAALALERVADGVFMVDRAGIVRLWNPAAEAITGLRADAVVGRAATEAIPGWAEAVHLLPVAEAPGVSATRPETVPLDIAGRELWLSFSAVGFSEGTVYAFRDLTEERRLDQLKTEFVATASHELRTPLAAVYGAAMTLRRQDLALDADRRDLLLAVIADESDRLARIVNDILWASRLDAGELAFEVKPFHARASVERVVEAARTHLPPGVELDLRAADELPPAAADESKVSQVVANLVDNAIKYSPDGGVIEVRLEQRDRYVRLSVKDEGIGIPVAEQARIFEKFYRLDPHLTRGVGGTGLGLYICRELVRRMNGRIWVTSSEGAGSTFWVELPLADGRPS